MDLNEEIFSRIKAAKSLNPTTRIEDFQVRVGENGTALVNIKTGRAQLVYDDDSKLFDLQDLHLIAT